MPPTKPPCPAWLAAHLYYGEPWHTFLSQAVYPFVQRMEPLISGYFFIRYWEGGPHVRLRFQAPPAVLEQQVQPELLRWFSTYFRRFPSDRPTRWQQDRDAYPNDSIQWIKYEPETARYGGAEAIRIAERQFQASSQAVLEVMQRAPWSYDRALGVALQMHLGMVHRLGMDLREATAFFTNVFERWLPRAYHRGNEPSATTRARRAQVLQAFVSSYHQQQSGVQQLLEQLWSGLEAGAAFGEPWFDRWLTDTQTVDKQLRDCQQQNRLVSPPYRTASSQLVNEARWSRWAIYDSYVHMTNNRLGIFNRDEAYLGFMMRESLQSLVNQGTVVGATP